MHVNFLILFPFDISVLICILLSNTDLVLVFKGVNLTLKRHLHLVSIFFLHRGSYYSKREGSVATHKCLKVLSYANILLWITNWCKKQTDRCLAKTCHGYWAVAITILQSLEKIYSTLSTAQTSKWVYCLVFSEQHKMLHFLPQWLQEYRIKFDHGKQMHTILACACVNWMSKGDRNSHRVMKWG